MTLPICQVCRKRKVVGARLCGPCRAKAPRYTLIAVCEGCGTEMPMTTTNPRRIYADIPLGWIQVGRSRHGIPGHAPRLASWCSPCQNNGTASRRLGITQENFSDQR